MALIALVRKWLGLIFPLFAKVGDFRGLGTLKWILHFLLVALILGALWWVNKYFNVGRFVKSSNEFVRDFFLPILFVLIYALGWFAWMVWKLFGPSEGASDYPDIDDAWEEGLAGLDAQRISLADTPLFLVLGQPAASPETVFQASGMNLVVKPRSVVAPVQVWASPDAIFVLAADASISGTFAVRLQGPPPDAPAQAAATDPADFMASIGAKSIGIADDTRMRIQDILDRAQREGRPVSEAEKAEMRGLAMPKSAGGGSGKPRAAGRTLMTSEEMSYAADRLRYLGRRIARDRDPFCSANGILVLVPWAATETNDLADEAALVVQRDVTAAREGLQLFCPVIAMFCDLEQARGFREFRAGFPSELLKRRLGQRLPLAPDTDYSKAPEMFEVGANYLGGAVMPTWVFKMLKTDPEPDEHRTAADVAKGNRNLHALLREVRARYPRLGRVLSRGLGGALAPEEGLDSPPLFGGCYIAGTGKSPEEQAFIPGVMQRLIENQGYVAWTPDVFSDDDWYRRNTRLGYIALGVFALAVVGAGVWFFGVKGV